MRIRVSNDLELMDAPASVSMTLDKELTLDNPDYIKAVTRGIGRHHGSGLDVWNKKTKRCDHIPKHIRLHWKDGNITHVPSGCLSDIIRMCPDCIVDYDRPFKTRVVFHGAFPLSDKQSEAVDACVRILDSPLMPMGGILTGPCGCGKTWMGLSIASRIGLKTLWICNTIILAEQAWKQACAQFGKVGMAVTKDGDLRIGERMTFATVQTLDKMDMSRLKDVWGLAIVDECHHCVGSESSITMFSHVVGSLNCIKFGLTATDDRTDGMMASAFAMLGPVIHSLEQSDMPERFCQIDHIKVEAHPTIDIKKCLTKTGTIDPDLLMKQLIRDPGRFNILCDTIRSCPKPCMVLSHRLELLDSLSDIFPDAVKLKDLKGDRQTDADTALATYQLASEGYDRKELRSLVFATPEGNEVRIIQTAGRVQRSCEGKEKGTIYDIVDICEYSKFRSKAKKRADIIRSLNEGLMDVNEG